MDIEVTSAIRGRVLGGKLDPLVAREAIADVIGRPLLDLLQPQLWPAELRGKTPTALASFWPEWVTREDAAIRARVRAGDEDSIVNFLLIRRIRSAES